MSLLSLDLLRFFFPQVTFVFPSKYFSLHHLATTKCSFNKFSLKLIIQVAKLSKPSVLTAPMFYRLGFIRAVAVAHHLAALNWGRTGPCDQDTYVTQICLELHWPSIKWFRKYTCIYQTFLGSYEIWNLILPEENILHRHIF